MPSRQMGRAGGRNSEFIFQLSVWCLISIFLYSLTAFWASLVDFDVPDPYLDEVFHVRQAQTYCDGYFDQWDPKITTPPGLYLISWLLDQIYIPCSVRNLRQTNVLLLSILLSNACMHLLVHTSRTDHRDTQVSPTKPTSMVTRKFLRNVHTTLNICLFPPLFFFSALYYTDVGSTAFVLVSAWLRNHPSIMNYPKLRMSLIVLIGAVTLLFRQTNIFWVAVFPAGLELVTVLSAPQNKSQNRPDIRNVIQQSWMSGEIYDVPYNSASLEDFVLFACSLTAASLANMSTTIRTILPYLMLIIAFAGFIVWNGGVVLGDKSNHIATLHLAQMLYIWPFIVFFSFPMIFPHVAGAVLPARYLRSIGFSQYTKKRSISSHKYYSTACFIISLFLALATVHKNTIVHPFTLADNRHYVFYVFRLLLRHPTIKYMVTPIYAICGWAVLETLCEPVEPRTSSTRNTKSEKISASSLEKPTYISYVFVWLIATIMTLSTAPLVEPRYVILPWIFWRLGVPGTDPYDVTSQTIKTDVQSATDSDGHMDARKTSNLARPIVLWMKRACRVLDHGDYRLHLETLWFLAVNAVTGYIFLSWGFEWQQEKGKVQRFMW